MDALLFTPPRQTLSYEVKIDTYNQKAKKKERRVTYMTDVESHDGAFGDSLVHFRRYDLLLDETRIHNAVNQIILCMGELFENLTLKINSFGEIKKVDNFKELNHKWETQIKYRISKTYKGALPERMIANVELKVRDQELFIRSLSRDPFYFAYIQCIFGQYQKHKRYCSRTIDSMSGIRNMEAYYDFELETDNNNRLEAVIGRGYLQRQERNRLMEQNNLNDLAYRYRGHYGIKDSTYIENMSVSQSLSIDGELSIKQDISTRLR